MPISDPAMKANTMGPAGLPTVVQKMDWFGRGDAHTAEPTFVRDQPDHQNNFEESQNSIHGNGNARDGGGNPITGRGHNERGDGHTLEPSFAGQNLQANFEETQNSARGNARTGGGNPITGQGYKEENVTHSKRRQFQQPLATKLW